MSTDTNDAKVKALRKAIADPNFSQAMSTNSMVHPRADFAHLLRRLDIAEVEFNQHDGQSEEPLDPPKT